MSARSAWHLALGRRGGALGIGEARTATVAVVSVTVRPRVASKRADGVISVARRGRAFVADDFEVLRSPGAEATVALESIALHFQVCREEVMGEPTGLANHRRFQELLNADVGQVRRHHTIGLIMVDIDEFKVVNDTYWHPRATL